MNYSGKKIFISHAHEDKNIAGALKFCLESLGFDAFVAHNDIIPSKQFREEIVKALDEFGVFVVIVSSNSNKSQWVQQEIGYAYARDRFFIPIKIDSENPKAFIDTIQALPIQVIGNHSYEENKDMYDSCANLIRLLIGTRKEGTTPSSTDNMINDLISSTSYPQSTSLFKKLDKISVLSDEQIDKLLDAALMNDQVRGNFDAGNFYERLLTKNRHYLDKEKMSKVRKLFIE